MARMTGGEALVQSLYREGVRVVFGLPGVQLYGVMAALRDEPRIRFITTRHEQATGYMADGYARASGEPGVALVVPGPGLLNAAAGRDRSSWRCRPRRWKTRTRSPSWRPGTRAARARPRPRSSARREPWPPRGAPRSTPAAVSTWRAPTRRSGPWPSTSRPG